MNGGEANVARTGRGSFGKGDFAPFNLAGRRPAKIKFDDGFARVRGSLVGVGEFGPAGGIGVVVGRIFGLGVRRQTFGVSAGAGFVAFDALIIFIAPMNA